MFVHQAHHKHGVSELRVKICRIELTLSTALVTRETPFAGPCSIWLTTCFSRRSTNDIYLLTRAGGNRAIMKPHSLVYMIRANCLAQNLSLSETVIIYTLYSIKVYGQMSRHGVIWTILRAFCGQLASFRSPLRYNYSMPHEPFCTVAWSCLHEMDGRYGRLLLD